MKQIEEKNKSLYTKNINLIFHLKKKILKIFLTFIL